MLVSPRVTSFFLTGAFTKSTSGPSFETIVLPGMNEWMSTPEAGTTQGKKMTPKTARVETKDPQSTTVCLVDLPHSLLVLVLRWVEALTYPDNDEVSGLVATFLGCESLCSALQSAVKDDAVWLGLSRRYQIRKVHSRPPPGL